MIPMTVADIARVTGGTPVGIDPHTVIPGPVEYDSRAVRPGSIFLALPGARVDGHNFAAQAHRDGAALALLSRDMGVPAILIPPVEHHETNSAALAEFTPEGEAALTALSRLAHASVEALTRDHGLTVVGVTGSAGKTSTKDYIATVLRTAGPTVAPPGSLNNEIGHPATALRCITSTRFLVAEMSARGIGHIAHLARIAPPHIGVVLNVGSAHLGEFGSREVIAQAKGELVEALPATGFAILNRDDDLVRQMHTRTAAQVVRFSAKDQTAVTSASAQTSAAAVPPADVWASQVELDETACATFLLHLPGAEPQPVHLQIPGEHNVSNALAAAAVGYCAGLPAAQIAQALSAHRAVSAHRMDVRHTASGVCVIDDAYNANPESMHAAFAAAVRIAQVAAPSVHTRHGHAIAVLGQMGELGEGSAEEHRRVGADAGASGIDIMVVVGEGENQKALAHAAADAGVEVHLTATMKDATAAALAITRPGDVVVCKASNAERLWVVADALSAEEATVPATPTAASTPSAPTVQHNDTQQVKEGEQ